MHEIKWILYGTGMKYFRNNGQPLKWNETKKKSIRTSKILLTSQRINCTCPLFESISEETKTIIKRHRIKRLPIIDENESNRHVKCVCVCVCVGEHIVSCEARCQIYTNICGGNPHLPSSLSSLWFKRLDFVCSHNKLHFSTDKLSIHSHRLMKFYLYTVANATNTLISRLNSRDLQTHATIVHFDLMLLEKRCQFIRFLNAIVSNIWQNHSIFIVVRKNLSEILIYSNID